MTATGVRYGRTTHSSISDGLAVKYEIFGEAPLQALGTIGGREFYFRARHDRWELEVENANESAPNEARPDFCFRREGKASNASFLPRDQATALIDCCIRQYLVTLVQDT